MSTIYLKTGQVVFEIESAYAQPINLPHECALCDEPIRYGHPLVRSAAYELTGNYRYTQMSCSCGNFARELSGMPLS